MIRDYFRIYGAKLFSKLRRPKSTIFKKVRDLKKSELLASHILQTVLVFLAFLGITLWGWQTARQALRGERQQIVERKINDTTTAFKTVIDTYTQVLSTSAGGLSATDYSLTQEQWEKFVWPLDLSRNYRNLEGLGFIKMNRRVSESSYALEPVNDRPLYASAQNAATLPDDIANLLKNGFYNDREQLTAMIQARDSGRPAISGKSESNPTDLKNLPTFIIYFPVYAAQTPPQNSAQRLATLTGFTFAPLNTKTLLQNNFGKDDPSYGYQVYASINDTESLLFESPNFKSISGNRHNMAQTTRNGFDNTFANVRWTIVQASKPDVVSDAVRNRPPSVLWVGFLSSTAVSMLLYAFLGMRTRSQEYSEERKIQQAKDELLALASHQLRTPATGVKQYVGMLREGYAGRLTREQHELLDQAYESNERQLNTITEMLSVAKADAGRMQLEKSKINMNKLLESIVYEQNHLFREREQTLTVSNPKTNIYTNVDTRTIRMAIENVINNASKYTPQNGSISIQLKRTQGNVVITVIDDGVGVAEKDMPLLFQKFSRIPNELTSDVSGSGIGLYLAKYIVDKHEGQIIFAANPTAGSTCTIILPL